MNIPYNSGGYSWNPYSNFNQANSFSQSGNNYSDKRIIWVNGIEGAKGYMLEPNQQVIMLDSEYQDRAYIKTSDALGRYNIIYLKIQEVSEDDLKNGSKRDIDFSNYITRDEFNAFVEKIIGGNNEQSVSAPKQQLTTISTLTKSN